MVSAQVVIALRESPWYGKASDHGARVSFLLMCREDCVAYAVEVEARLVGLSKIHALRLALSPTFNKRLLSPIKVLQQSIPCLLPRLIRRSSKSKSRNTLTIVRYQFEFCSQSNVSIRGGRIFPRHLLFSANVLPTITNTPVPAAHLPESALKRYGGG